VLALLALVWLALVNLVVVMNGENEHLPLEMN
jgi:hypothetical protein